jgi:hypothetical protein
LREIAAASALAERFHERQGAAPARANAIVVAGDRRTGLCEKFQEKQSIASHT